MQKSSLIISGIVALAIAGASLTDNPFVGIYGIAIQSGFETLIFFLTGIWFVFVGFTRPELGNFAFRMVGIVFLIGAVIQGALLSNISFGNSSDYISIVDSLVTLFAGVFCILIDAIVSRKLINH